MLLSSITLKNILSLKDARLELRPLNVLIGPNASGKSNLLDAVGLLQAAPVDLNAAILRGGGIRCWLWKGNGPSRGAPVASLECRVKYDARSTPLLYRLVLSEAAGGFVIQEERFQDAAPARRAKQPRVYFDRRLGQVTLGKSAGDKERVGQVLPSESVLARLKSPMDPTTITRLGREFERIGLYKEFNTGPLAPARTGVSTSIRKDMLRDGGDNLAVVLNEMEYQGSLARVNEYLNRFCDNFAEVKIRIEGPTAQAYVREKGLAEPILASRLSDGTLKFLCLLVVLFHPEPPPLICMEEPELGLHPDALQLVAEVLEEASQHTQLMVTTHSEALVDALSGKPEAVVVCERDRDNATVFRRLEKKQLDVWLKRYTLGELWRKGEIGGNRW